MGISKEIYVWSMEEERYGGVVTGDSTGKEVEVCGFECDGCVTGNLMSVCD